MVNRITALAGSLGIAAAFLATPALANSANADISAPLRAAATGSVGQAGGDQQFKQLFSSWKSADRGAGFITAVTSTVGSALHSVSIPSLMPVQGVRLTSEFGMRWHPILGGRHQHKGVDLAGPVGTPVHATADGVVGRADWFSGYGLYIALEHGGELETRYGHMSRLNVAAGQVVHKGDVIGYIGTTGRTTGPHLHYEVRIAGVAVNPIPYMQGDGSALAADMAAVAAAPAGHAEADAGDE
jgi:murein DD-endopeptidase MepM/ murein hydrolase activator NlpD